jgi:hypothetical protein
MPFVHIFSGFGFGEIKFRGLSHRTVETFEVFPKDFGDVGFLIVCAPVLWNCQVLELKVDQTKMIQYPGRYSFIGEKRKGCMFWMKSS